MSREEDEQQQQARPFLSSEEMMWAAGVSRRILTAAEEREISVPARGGSIGKSLGWNISQAEILSSVAEMRNAGMGFSDIEKLHRESRVQFLQSANVLRARAMHASRRAFKSSALLEGASGAKPELPTPDCFYLKYLPQRWVALLPLSQQSAASPSRRTDALAALREIARCVGWNDTFLEGTMHGGPSSERADSYSFIVLATQPMPAPSRLHGPDTGCYEAFGGLCCDAGEKNCEGCCFFGAEAHGLKAKWEIIKGRNDIVAHVLTTLGDMHRPSVGPWSGEDGIGAGGPIAAKPALMPLPTALPARAVAGVLPAGFYLCRHHAASEQDGVVKETLGMSRAIPRRDMTVADEQSSIESIATSLEKAGAGQNLLRFGPCSDTASKPQPIGDPSLIGWTRALSDGDLRHLRILTNTGLTPASDFYLLCSNLPEGDDGRQMMETQILVDASELLRSNARTSRGIAAAITASRKAREQEGRPRCLCRSCGATIVLEGEKGVAVCPTCGRARTVPNDTSSQGAGLVFASELALVEHRAADAIRDAKRAKRRCSKDPEAYFASLCAVYGARWDANAAEGVRLLAKDEVINASLLEDPNCKAILELADQERRELYVRALYKMERARLLALGEL